MLDDNNITNYKQSNGLNYLNDYSLLCHLNKSNFKKNKDYLKEYSKKNKTIYLPEEDVIVISNNKIEFIGNKKYVIFKNGNYAFHNFANLKKDMM